MWFEFRVSQREVPPTEKMNFIFSAVSERGFFRCIPASSSLHIKVVKKCRLCTSLEMMRWRKKLFSQRAIWKIGCVSRRRFAPEGGTDKRIKIWSGPPSFVQLTFLTRPAGHPMMHGIDAHIFTVAYQPCTHAIIAWKGNRLINVPGAASWWSRKRDRTLTHSHT